MAVFLVSCGDDEDCDFGDPVITQADGTAEVKLGDQESNARLAQRFRLTESITLAWIDLTIRKEGEPAGDLRVFIHDDEGGRPSDNPISDGKSEVLLNSEISDVLTLFQMVFPNGDEPDLSADRDYYFVIEDLSGVIDSANYFVFTASSSDVYADGELWAFDRDEPDNDAAWMDDTGVDMEFEILKCVDEDDV